MRTDCFNGDANSMGNGHDDHTGSEMMRFLSFQAGFVSTSLTEYGADFDHILRFGDHDQYFTVFLDPTNFYNDKGEQVDETKVPYLRSEYVAWGPILFEENASHDGFYGDAINSALYIANIGFLPEDTKVEWEVQPAFDISKDEKRQLHSLDSKK